MTCNTYIVSVWNSSDNQTEERHVKAYTAADAITQTELEINKCTTFKADGMAKAYLSISAVRPKEPSP